MLSIESVDLKAIAARMKLRMGVGRFGPDDEKVGQDIVELWLIYQRLVSQLLGLKANKKISEDICPECADWRWYRPHVDGSDLMDFMRRRCRTCCHIRLEPEGETEGKDGP